MSRIANMTSEEKVAIVCLYFARLKSDDERYKGVCHPVLRKLAAKYAMKYNTVKNNIVDNSANQADMYNVLIEEVGVIPPVGKNIADYIYIVAVCISIGMVAFIGIKIRENNKE